MKRALLSSILTIVACVCLISGATLALFTDKASVNVAVTSAKVKVTATVDPKLVTWSLGESETDNREGSFANGGAAVIDENGQLQISRMTPGDCVSLILHVTNSSDIAIQYRVKVVSTAADEEAVDLSDALLASVRINGITYEMQRDSEELSTGWFLAKATDGVGEAISDITVTLTFPNGEPTHDNIFQNASTTLTVLLEAVQGNGFAVDSAEQP